MSNLDILTKTDSNVDAGDSVSVTCSDVFGVQEIHTAIANSAGSDIMGDIRVDADGIGTEFLSVDLFSDVDLGATQDRSTNAFLPPDGVLTIVFETEVGDTGDEALTAHLILQVKGDAIYT